MFSLVKNLLGKTAKIAANNGVFKTMRLLYPALGNMRNFMVVLFQVPSGMNATMTRINAIFNKDLAVRLAIISSNTLLFIPRLLILTLICWYGC
jgi:hypothetical protein